MKEIGKIIKYVVKESTLGQMAGNKILTKNQNLINL